MIIAVYTNLLLKSHYLAHAAWEPVQQHSAPLSLRLLHLILEEQKRERRWHDDGVLHAFRNKGTEDGVGLGRLFSKQVTDGDVFIGQGVGNAGAHCTFTYPRSASTKLVYTVSYTMIIFSNTYR